MAKKKHTSTIRRHVKRTTRQLRASLMTTFVALAMTLGMTTLERVLDIPLSARTSGPYSMDPAHGSATSETITTPQSKRDSLIKALRSPTCRRSKACQQTLKKALKRI